MDNTKRKGLLDSSRVNIDEEWKVTYWTEEFKCSVIELETTILQVSTSVDEVKVYLEEIKK